MKTSSKIVWIVGALEALVLVAALVIWGWNTTFSISMAGMCDGTVYSRATTPNKTLIAYAFHRDCGATTSFATFVIYKSVSQPFKVSDPLENDNIIFSTDGEYPAKLKWLSNDKLQIEFSKDSAPSQGEIWQQSVVIDKIQLVYKGLKSSSQ